MSLHTLHAKPLIAPLVFSSGAGTHTMSSGLKYANGQIAFSFLEDGSGFSYYKTGARRPTRAHAARGPCERRRVAPERARIRTARRSRRRVREHGQRVPEPLLLLRR